MKELYNYNRSQMMSVDILFCTGAHLIRHCAMERIERELDYDGVPVARLIQFCEPHW